MKKKILFVICFMITLSGFSQYTTIPNTDFENALSAYDDISGDNQVPTANINGITTLVITNPSPASYPTANTFLSDLTGIQDFTALTSLTCNDASLGALDLSTNPNLTYFEARRSGLTSLDVTSNIALDKLWVSGNNLSVINVSQNVNLTWLWVHFNDLTTLDVSSNSALLHLVCGNNNLTTLDVSNNLALFGLYSVNSGLTSMDVSVNIALTRLELNQNDLTSLDVRNGNTTNFTHFSTTTTPNLTCILVDDVAAWNAAAWVSKDAASTFVNDDAACTVLSIQQNTFGSLFSVYPNPSNGISTIKFGDTYAEVALQIVDVLGKVISMLHYNDTDMAILDIEKYTSGVYFIKVQSGKKSATIKLIVN